MEIETSPGRALSSSFNLGDFKTRLGSIDPRRCSPTALPPPPPLCEEDEDRMMAAEAEAEAAAATAAAAAAAAPAADEGAEAAMQEGVAASAEEEDPEPQPMGEAELRGEVARAREAFMLRRWAGILAQVKASGGVEGVKELAAAAGTEDKGNEEHLARLYASAEGGLREMVAGCLEEEARQGEAYDRLLERKAEVEALLGTLEQAQARLARQQEAAQRGEEAEEDEDSEDEEEDDEDEDDKAAAAETARLEAALAAARAEKGAVDGQAAALERQLEGMKQQAAAQGEAGAEAEVEMGVEEEDDADSVSTTGDEEALRQEAAELREHGEWLETLLGTLRQLYQVTVKVEEEEDSDEAAAAAATGLKKRTVFLRVTYPSQHALELTLAAQTPVAPGSGGSEQAAGVVALVDACMELPPQQARRKSVAVAEAARGLNQQVQALLSLAKGLPAPGDLMFMAREAGWVVQGKGVLRKEVRELMKRYVVKHSEAKAGAAATARGSDELTISFNEGVVATFGLLPGYPQMPGSVRIVSLVGIGGWKDAELAVTARSLNGLGLESLTALVESLQERLSELDKGV